MAERSKSSSGKILHNSFWYGLETIVEAIVFLGTSIAVARYLGPEKLGYFSYINFFVSVLTRTSGTGLSTATRKYMSEFLALDRPGMARSIYDLAYRYQLIASISIAALGLAGVLLFGDPHYHLMSAILMVSIVPGLMSWVPAQANQAFEDVSNNTFSAFGYIVSYSLVIGLTIYFRWDLIGVASASLVGRTIEVLLRTIPLNKTLRQLPLDSLERETVARMRRFCVQAVGLQLLMSVVWDRSEMVFLRAFSTFEQTAFYSVSFTFATNLLMLPRIFSTSTGITLMGEAGRDPKRVNAIVQNGCRFLFLIVLPVCLGAAAIAFPAIRLAYGVRYVGAVPAIVVAAILVIPRSLQGLPETLMRTADRQNRILLCYIITGIVNIVLDFLLIPRYGAVGAAWGNGLAQGFGVVLIWMQGQRFYEYRFPMSAAIRLACASLPMAAIAFLLSHRIVGPLGLATAILVAVPVYLVLLKLFHGLEPSDRTRLNMIGSRLPASAGKAYLAAVRFVTPELKAG